MNNSIQKIINKMHNQPNGIRPEEAEKVLENAGYVFDRQKGSHKNFLHTKTGDVITIKVESPLKAVYIKDILKRIE